MRPRLGNGSVQHNNRTNTIRRRSVLSGVVAEDLQSTPSGVLVHHSSSSGGGGGTNNNDNTNAIGFNNNNKRITWTFCPLPMPSIT